MNRERTKLRISDSPIPSREFEQQLMDRMIEYHRRFGRGPDGPFSPLECARRSVDPTVESTPAVLVPGGRPKLLKPVNPESEVDDGGG